MQFVYTCSTVSAPMGKTTNLPTQAVIVDCVLDPINPSPVRSSVEHRLRTGCYGHIRWRNGDATFRGPFYGNRDYNFWEAIYRTGDQSKPIWIVGWHISRFLKVTGFFREWNKQRLLPLPSTGEGGPRKGRQPLLVLESPPVIFVVWQDGFRKLIIVDLANYFRTTFDKFAAGTGAEHLDDLPDTANDIQIENYLRKRITVAGNAFASLREWCKSLGSDLAYTAAGQALMTYRQCFGWPHKIIRHDDAEVKSFERKGHYSGLSAIFSQGPHNEPIWHLDVRSHYPYQMIAHKLPCELVSVGRADPGFIALGHEAALSYMADVELSPSGAGYPVRSRGSVHYPPGPCRTVLAGPELARAVSLDDIRHVHFWCKYRMAPVLRDYALAMLELRNEAEETDNPAWEMLAKLLANSIFGKFSERRSTWQQVEPPFDAPDWGTYYGKNYETGEYVKHRMIGGTAWIEGERELAPHAFVPISAWVTAYGREHMRKLITEAGQENVYYVATDALFVNEQGYYRLLHQLSRGVPQPGELRVVDCRVGARFDAIGCYSYGSERTQAGMQASPTSVTEISWDSVEYQSLATSMHDALETRIVSYVRRKNLYSENQDC